MLVPDVNVLVYAYDLNSGRQTAASDWLEATLSGREPVGFAWVALLGFVRISTNPRVYESPLSPAGAFDFVGDWLARPPVRIIEPGRRHLAIVRSLLDGLGTAGNLTTDAHLAALAIERNATLVSFDNDFSRFSGLEWMMPTIER